MNREQRRMLYKKMYFFELDRREKINARLGIPFAVMTGVAGMLAFLLNSSSKPSAFMARWLFWGGFGLSLIGLVVAGWFFKKAWFGHVDNLIGYAERIEDYRRKVFEHFVEEVDIEKSVSEVMDDYIIGAFIKGASINGRNNDERSESLYRTMVALLFSLLMAVTACAPFYLGR